MSVQNTAMVGFVEVTEKGAGYLRRVSTTLLDDHLRENMQIYEMMMIEKKKQ